MSIERDVNVAAQTMFKHAKTVIMRNVMQVINDKGISIDKSVLPGLELIIGASIDDSFKQSSKELSAVLKKHKII
jgi:hypothetical protein